MEPGAITRRRQFSALHPAAIAALSIGVALVGGQWMANPSLWVDELAIVRNIQDRSAWELSTRLLSFDQVAPVGFLLALKGMMSVFGTSELALRALPVITAVVSLAIIAGIANRLHPLTARPVPILLTGLCITFIWYAAQVKQYSGDVAIAALVLWLAIALPQTPSRLTRSALAVLGLMAPWMSQPAVFVLAPAGAVLAYETLRSSDRRRTEVLAIIALWGVSSVLALLNARGRVSPDTMAFMTSYWADGFPTLPPRTVRDLQWPLYHVRALFETLANGRAGFAFMIIAAAGAWRLWKVSRRTLILLAAPMALAMLAAAARQYPFSHRLALFLLPSIVLLVAVGIEVAVGVARIHNGALAAVTRALFLVVPALELVKHPPPYRQQHIRPILAEMALRMRPGDAVYVPYGSWQPWHYYAPRFGLDRFPTVLGTCRGPDIADYEPELDALAHFRRVWIVFTPAGALRSAESILTNAQRRGREVGRVERANHDILRSDASVGAYLFEMDSLKAPPTAIRAERSSWSGVGEPAPPAARSCRGAAVPSALVSR